MVKLNEISLHGSQLQTWFIRQNAVWVVLTFFIGKLALVLLGDIKKTLAH